MLKGAIRNFSNVIGKNQNYFQTGFPKTDTSFGFIVSPKNARSALKKSFTIAGDKVHKRFSYSTSFMRQFHLFLIKKARCRSSGDHDHD